jgi:hypothetical protein
MLDEAAWQRGCGAAMLRPFRAMSCRGHRRIVSGVTIVATRASIRRPSLSPRAANRPVMIRQPQTLMAQLRPQDAVLFAQVMILCCSCWSQPRKDATKSCTGITVRSLRQLPGAVFGHYGISSREESSRLDSRSAQIQPRGAAHAVLSGYLQRIGQLQGPSRGSGLEKTEVPR